MEGVTDWTNWLIPIGVQLVFVSVSSPNYISLRGSWAHSAHSSGMQIPSEEKEANSRPKAQTTVASKPKASAVQKAYHSQLTPANTSHVACGDSRSKPATAFRTIWTSWPLFRSCHHLEGTNTCGMIPLPFPSFLLLPSQIPLPWHQVTVNCTFYEALVRTADV